MVLSIISLVLSLVAVAVCVYFVLHPKEGPIGPQGLTGEKGDRGPRGYKGEKGVVSGDDIVKLLSNKSVIELPETEIFVKKVNIFDDDTVKNDYYNVDDIFLG